VPGGAESSRPARGAVEHGTLGALLLTTGACLVYGLTGDAVTVAATLRRGWGPFQFTLVDERETFSILSSLVKLWHDGNILLASVIVLFSVVFPLSKWLTNLSVWWRLRKASGGRLLRAAQRLQSLGRWSMLDVFVLALLCVWAKLGETTRILPEPALYAFLASVVLGLLCAGWTTRLLRLAAAPGSPDGANSGPTPRPFPCPHEPIP
jgi:paraquat-inducible protein A